MAKKNSRITIRDISRRARVSPGTVDRVIHSRGGVSEKTKSLVLAIIRDMNYQPDILARTLASRKTIRIAALYPGKKIGGAFWELPVKGIDRAMEEISHFGVVVDKFPFDRSGANSFERVTEKALSISPDGILIAPVFTREARILSQRCSRKGISFVYINSTVPGQHYLSFIGQDSLASGKVAASLIHHCIDPNSRVLIVNISGDIDNQLHLLSREKGFRSHMTNVLGRKKSLVTSLDIPDNGLQSISKALDACFGRINNVEAIFVTNSRVFHVAHWLSKVNQNKIFLAGYDLLPESISYMQQGVIDYLISQKPEEQVYRGIMSLFQRLVLNKNVASTQFLPIDIITSENVMFYETPMFLETQTK